MDLGNSNELVKICINLSANSIKSETVWAKPLGGDQYEIRNSPFFAYGVHFRDVVRAASEIPGEILKLIDVVRPSGYRTIRVLFAEEVNEFERVDMIASLGSSGVSYENADGLFFALSVEPNGNYKAVCNQLQIWKQEEKLEYEANKTFAERGESDSGD